MITREEFEKLLDAFAKSYGEAVYARAKTSDEYQSLIDKAADARIAVVKAVFPE